MIDERDLLERGALVIGMTEGGDVGVWRKFDPDGRSAHATGDTIMEAIEAFARAPDAETAEGDG